MHYTSTSFAASRSLSLYSGRNMPRSLVLRCLRLGLAAACLFAAVPARAAAPTPTAPARAAAPEPLKFAAEDFGPRREQWYGIFDSKETQIGWIRTRLKPADNESSEFEISSEARMRLLANGVSSDFHLKERRRFSGRAPYSLESCESSESQGGFDRRVKLKVEGGRGEAEVKEGGQTRKMDFPRIEMTLADALGLETWLRRARRAAGEMVALRAFSTTSMAERTHTYRVRSFKPAANGGGRYEIERHDGETGEVELMIFQADGALVSHRLQGGWTLRLLEKDDARRLGEGEDVFLSGLIPIDRALGDPTSVAELVLVLEGEGAKALPGGPRQDIAKEGDRYVLSVGDAHGKPLAATPAETAEALKESSEYPVGNPTVAALAKTAVGNAATPVAKAERLIKFVHDYIGPAEGPDPISVLDVIKKRQGDCTEHAMLFVTLARAAGLPAREVSGVIYMGDDHKAFGGHAWVEVALDGRWVSMDPTWNQTKIDATHIRYGSESAARAIRAALEGGIRFTLRRLEIVRTPPVPTKPAPHPPVTP